MVQVEKGHVAVVFLNDPERRNPLSPEMALSLLQALDDLEADPGVRAVLLTGRLEASSDGASVA